MDEWKGENTDWLCRSTHCDGLEQLLVGGGTDSVLREHCAACSAALSGEKVEVPIFDGEGAAVLFLTYRWNQHTEMRAQSPSMRMGDAI